MENVSRLILSTVLLTSAVYQSFSAHAGDKSKLFDRNVKEFKLKNGLTIWVRPQKSRPGKVSMWLVIKAGTLVEGEGERGAAHFVEHMFHQGSEHFEPGEAKKAFGRKGIAGETDFNAQTGLHKTRAIINNSPNDNKTMKLVVRYLADCAFRLKFPANRIEVEKKVLLKERSIRVSSQVYQDWQNRLWSVAGNSRVTRCLEIASQETILRTTRDSLVSFHRKWYVPRNALLIVVGDVDPKALHDLAQREFSKWPDRTVPRRPGTGLKKMDKRTEGMSTLYPNNPSELRLYVLQGPQAEQASVLSLTAQITEELGWRMFKARFKNALREPGSQLTKVYAQGGNAGDGFTIREVVAKARLGAGPAAFRQFIHQLRVLSKFGFQKHELALAKRSMLRDYRMASRREETCRHLIHLKGLERAWLQGRPPISDTRWYGLCRAVLKNVTCDKVDESLSKGFFEMNEAILLKIPFRGEERKKWLEKYDRAMSSVPPAKRPPAARPVLERLIPVPSAGKVNTRVRTGEKQVTCLKLANGIRVNIGRRDRRDPERVHVILTLIGGEIEETARNRGITGAAAQVFSGPATMRHGYWEINDFKVGKGIRILPLVVGHTISLWCTADAPHLDDLLQVLHQLLTRPRLDTTELKRWRRDRLELSRRQLWAPTLLARATAIDLLSSRDVRIRRPTTPEILAVKEAEAQKWLERLVRKAPLEIGIIGDMDPPVAERLSVRYFGSLPARLDNTKHLDKLRQLRPFTGPKEAVEKIQRATRTSVLVAWKVDDWEDAEKRNMLAFADQLCKSRLYRKLRDELGLVYSIQPLSRSRLDFKGLSWIGFQMLVKEQDAPRVAAIIREEFKDLSARGPLKEEVELARKAKVSDLHRWLESARSQAVGLSMLSWSDGHYDLSKRLELCKQVTAEDLQAFFRETFQEKNRIQVICSPKKDRN